MKTSKKGQMDPAKREDSIGRPSVRPYSPPRILSAEPLEAMAAACVDNNPGGPGKGFPATCATLGS